MTNQSPWSVFASSRPDLVFLHDQRIDVSLRPWVNADDPALPLDPAFREELLATKAAVYSELETERAAAIAQHQAEPMADFLLASNPPSIFLNFRIKPEHRKTLAARIPVPQGFYLTPIQPHAGVKKDYYMSLNIYLAGGLAPGYRAEWSIYVAKDDDPRPRFMIVDLLTSTYSIDPLHLITIPADVFSYTNAAGLLSVDLRTPELSFQADIRIPSQPEHRELTLDWAECNTFVYWRNGVADKIYYNESSYGDVSLVPASNAFIEDRTPWANYIQLDHIFIYQKPQTFVASPWNNLNELQGSYGF